MKLKSILVTLAVAAAAALSLNALAAGEPASSAVATKQADAAPMDKKADGSMMNMQGHMHHDAAATDTAKAKPARKSAGSDRKRHYHPRDGK